MPQNKHSSGKKQGFRGPSPDVGKATQFKPGQSGNPGGRQKKKPLTEAYERKVSDPEVAQAIAQGQRAASARRSAA